ncbi:hypothetical protein BMS3Bbin16_00155 [archaeon BMS3Bbin16]|nr:hypothetical protein BMS3Bbin16_00155 [archaeon BMS3Bbin16]
MVQNNDISKSERKKMKKEKRIEQRESRRRERDMREKKNRLVKYGVIALIVIVAAFYMFNRDSNSAEAAVIKLDPTVHDFGDVSVAGGVVSTTMTIKNNGGSDLVISDMDSSCGCTSATITKDGVEGPVFGMKMHGKNPVDWSETLLPGETAQLNIYYDPTVHQDLRGAVTRAISIYSNDPNHKISVAKIEVNQVD